MYHLKARNGERKEGLTAAWVEAALKNPTSFNGLAKNDSWSFMRETKA
jgi:hypothetical protein